MPAESLISATGSVQDEGQPLVFLSVNVTVIIQDQI